MTSAGLKIGATIGDRYRVHRLLGRGELGCVYLCHDLIGDETPVALRTLTEWDRARAVAASRQELSFLVRLRHPNLAHLLDFGVVDGSATAYLVRQFVEGVDFLKGSEGWSVDQVLEQLVRICRVLQYLHSRGVVHSHLKPSNVILTGGEVNELEPKVLDYGLNRRAMRVRRGPAALAYTAPEVFLGHSRSPKSDLYSLGILAYQLLTRHLPFDDEDEGYLIQKHLQGRADMRPIERLSGGAGLAQVLLGLLEKDLEKRPSSAEDVIRSLSAASGRDYSGMVSRSLEAYFSAGPFVGREKEMTWLQERAVRVRENGRGCTVFLTGESGSGKSRCLAELRTWALLEGWRVVEAGCLPREDRSYGPYRRILARAGLLGSGRADGGAKNAIFRFDDVARVAESGQVELSSGAAAGPFRDLLTREIVRLLADRPTLLLLHDFHWADEATITVLDYLTSDILAHPIFLCVSLRPGEADHGSMGRLMDISARQSRAETLTLEALGLPAVGDLISGITGEASLGREIGPWIHKSCGGNPFFVEEILKHLVDRGVLRRDLGKWRLATGESENLEAPSSIAAVLRHRLAKLSPGATVLTEWLALLRRAVPREDLRALSSVSIDELEARLSELISRQVLQEVGGGDSSRFEFRHALISEVIVENLTASRQRRMHRKIGEVLEQHHGDQENLQELATHFTEGKCGEKAVRYALRAARECKSEFANESAMRFYEYALNHNALLPVEELCEVCIESAETCCALGNPKRAIRILESEIPRRNSHSTWNAFEVRRLLRMALSFQHMGDFRALESTAKRGLRLLRRLKCNEDGMLKASFLRHLAYCAVVKSRPAEAMFLSRLALEAISDMGDVMLQGQIYTLISAIHRMACDLRGATSAAEKAIKILEPTGALLMLSIAYSHEGTSRAALGRFRLARQSHERAVLASGRTRSPILRSQALCNLAECLCRWGHLQEASETALRSCKLAAEVGNPSIYHSASATMAEIKLAKGDYAEAQEILSHLNSDVNADLPLYSKAHVCYLSAWLCYETAAYTRAIEHLEALARIESIEAPIYERELGEVLRAKILHLQGNTQAALQLLLSNYASLKRKRWPYQLCAVQIALAELLLDGQDHASASKYLRYALRLASAMSCPQFQADAWRIQSRILIDRLRSEPADNVARIRLEQVRGQLLDALAEAQREGAKVVVWRLCAAVARVAEMLQDLDGSLTYSNKTLECQDLLTRTTSGGHTMPGCANPEQDLIRLECQERIRRLQRKGATPSVLIGEIEEEHLRTLFRVSCLINAIRDLNQLTSAVVVLMARAVGMERVLLALKDEDCGKLHLAQKLNFEANSMETMDSLSRQVMQDVVRSGNPFVTADTRRDPRFSGDEVLHMGAFLCGPLIVCGRIIGLVYADQRLPTGSLSESTINLFAALCNIAAVAIDNAMAHGHLMHEKSQLERYLREISGEYSELVGKGELMRKLRERLALAAASPLDVLIGGESGTGKELVARALHRTGRRAKGKFIALDCGSLSDSLVESELFGYRKGAFTGAVEDRPGLFEAADGGVVFLDEICNLSLGLQRKLLRVLQEREVRRIGETSARRISVQVIAATNKDLLEEIHKGTFRKDLYFRLNPMEIRVPPLRERREDLPLLLEWFLDKVTQNEGGRIKAYSQEAHALLLQYSYPGNVRELKNIVEGSYYSTPGSSIDIEHLPEAVRHCVGEFASWESAPAAWRVYKKIHSGLGSFDDLVKNPFLKRRIGPGQVRQVIHLALVKTGGRYRDAFRLLGIPTREYSIMIQFLKRNDCYLDFRPYRKSARQNSKEQDL